MAEDINALNARVDELDGKVGTGGGNGLTPHIGDNGNWWIGDTDTLKPARGERAFRVCAVSADCRANAAHKVSAAFRASKVCPA